MRIRNIVLALPIVVGFAACKTSSTQGTGTASARPEASDAHVAGTTTGNVYERHDEQADTTSREAAGAASTPGAAADLRGHSDDQLVTGKISHVSPQSVTITTDDGQDRTLRIVPETWLRVNGQDAQSTDLAEGLPVRASFSNVEDRDVAVEIRAGTSAVEGATPADIGLTPGTNTGAGKGESSTGSTMKNPTDSHTQEQQRR